MHRQSIRLYRIVFFGVTAVYLCSKVSAAELPELTGDAAHYLPSQGSDFLMGLQEMAKAILPTLLPELQSSVRLCVGILAAGILCGLISDTADKSGLPAKLVGTFSISVLLLSPTELMIRQALSTVTELTEYGQLLLPVMSGAMAASGGTSSAAALYLGTAFFSSLLMRFQSKVVIPGIYMYLALAVTGEALDHQTLKKLRELLKKLIAWGMRLILTLFSAYMAFTGVISGAADGAALKAMKMTASATVPVVGGMISDAAGTILAGASVLRASVGVGGVFCILAIVLAPFLRSGIQYLVLKVTAALAAVLGSGTHGELVDSISQAMGFGLGMLATGALLELISVVCFMKGVNA